MGSPTQPSPEIVWLEGLSQARIRLVSDDDFFDEASFLRLAQPLPSFRKGAASYYLSFADRVDQPGVVGRLAIRRVAAGGRLVELSLHESHALEQRLSTFDELPGLIAAAFAQSLAETWCGVNGSFQVPTARWESVITLPIVLPAGGDLGRGAPEISGLEFTFRDEDVPVRYASLSRFEDTFDAYLQADLSIEPIESLVARALDTLRDNLRLLLAPLPTPTPSITP